MIECPGCAAEVDDDLVSCPHCRYRLDLTPLEIPPQPPEDAGTGMGAVPPDIDPPDWRPANDV